MGDIAIRVDNLSKKYKIGLAKPHDTLRDQLADGLKTLFYRNGHQSPAGGRGSQPSDTVWALKDVSFEINQGEVVGIIGANGSGKSTLLKILSRITEPTVGLAEIRGRVGSLLEVGTGFHSELTGRENIYLNSAILGMRKGEIERKFDEIVAFSEVERFIDEPVKHYSSGMYVRLAFAVAAHLEPEVLIVDEVLAVGDVDFQKKCLGKMQDISKSDGRTILFVSHNMDSIQRLCSKCFMLKEGQLVAQGETASVVVNYLSRSCCRAQPNQWIDVSHMNRGGTGQTHFLAVQYSSLNEAVAFQPYSNGPLEFLLAIESDRQRSVGSLAITLYSQLPINSLQKVSNETPMVSKKSSSTFPHGSKAIVGCWVVDRFKSPAREMAIEKSRYLGYRSDNYACRSLVKVCNDKIAAHEAIALARRAKRVRRIMNHLYLKSRLNMVVLSLCGPGSNGIRQPQSGDIDAGIEMELFNA